MDILLSNLSFALLPLYSNQMEIDNIIFWGVGEVELWNKAFAKELFKAELFTVLSLKQECDGVEVLQATQIFIPPLLCLSPHRPITLLCFFGT